MINMKSIIPRKASAQSNDDGITAEDAAIMSRLGDMIGETLSEEDAELIRAASADHADDPEPEFEEVEADEPDFGAEDAFAEDAVEAAPELPTPARRNIWDIDEETGAAHVHVPEAELDVPSAETEAAAQATPAPAPQPQPRPTPESPSPLAARRQAMAVSRNDGRTKTRLLGFHGGETARDVFASAPDATSGAGARYPIGWLVVMDGPGRGASFTLTAGLSTIGRGADQTVALDFGDAAVSRNNHASIAYDEEENRAYIGHGGKSNIVRLNGQPLLSTEEIGDGDEIRVGKTTLRYVAFCGPDFTWNRPDDEAETPADTADE